MRTATFIITFVITFVVTVAALAGTVAAAPDTAANCRGKRSDSMNAGSAGHAGFEQAQSSFRSHAARVLKLAPDRVLVSPIEEDPSVQLDQRVGAAWAFYGSSKDQPSQQVRGWAVADGTVITPDENLGLLLAEAGVWSAKPALDASALAERLVWAMGMNHRLVGARSLHVDPKGTGTLSFQVAYRPPGPGGAGGGRERVSQCTVTLTADHHAKLTTTAAAPAAPVTPSFD
jgi:hypothetical protein